MTQARFGCHEGQGITNSVTPLRWDVEGQDKQVAMIDGSHSPTADGLSTLVEGATEGINVSRGTFYNLRTLLALEPIGLY